ncbi:acetoin:2,6-dichlorophenolindophenol oxidoreductase subunit alpha [Mycolicibacterium chitae]|uniref:Pyruvate/2-oxoglutarate dehydrogenase complex, dehydrogenase component alpha subunit n=1 Tax=Mycolicibacterium chitae TaxID=1792 RepID=A0A3S4RFU8_MYCCI|nr:thiamine pyrophosphate-dependent dehydrogenase E1 component subunit alpha [Mycolicibacterium chitae]MCV7107793.1 thiamine pyrophosphate-dependent dehydrogenase E1 component subunit alpha [Mycolicibacterium chitae]BBZ05794.1 acetoin:2,6-dichlorophenolindophenol oxidoreductase subunit alpha [Mycolicibacterium chitae]VEG49404.1 pyruvate/2-oxoglutarate dehydrogenase complex, dehydrogenase component alpha subunit [Mycolicibacterium chitae]
MTSTADAAVGLGVAELTAIFTTATRIKVCDEKFRSLILTGQVSAQYYSPRGQEIISASIGALLEPTDYVVTTYRGLHDQLAKGVPLRELWAEFFGKATGTCKGKGGPMHITHPESGLMVTTGIVGSGLPIANGLALASQLRGDGRVTVVNFGDGATNIGAFHEACNLAALWKLPVVFCCHNNRYAEHTSFEGGTSVDRVADRAAAYKMPGVRVDGNDPVAMYEAARQAIERARNGEGPTLLEAMTFRFFGHQMSDQNEYMQPGELERERAADPVLRFRAWLIDNDVLSESAVETIEAQAKADVQDAFEFAEASPVPDLAEGLTDVYEEALA